MLENATDCPESIVGLVGRIVGVDKACAVPENNTMANMAAAMNIKELKR